MTTRGWTAAQIPDQSGRTAVVTGANSGLGLIVAGELARRGARVVFACRDTERAEAARRRIDTAVPEADVVIAQLDLADLSSVRSFVERLPVDELDLLVNNAGVMALPYRRTADGFEMQFGTNHLGHFALTGLLLPRLLAREGSRVVTVSSGAHRGAALDFDDLQSERSYGAWSAYGRSKLANLLFTTELQRRADEERVSLRAMAAHPGLVATNLHTAGARMANKRWAERMIARGIGVVAGSPERGSLPILYAATTPDLPGDSFIGPPRGRPGRAGAPAPIGRSAAARDGEAARRLWEVSEDLTGVVYDFT